MLSTRLGWKLSLNFQELGGGYRILGGGSETQRWAEASGVTLANQWSRAGDNSRVTLCPAELGRTMGTGGLFVSGPDPSKQSLQKAGGQSCILYNQHWNHSGLWHVTEAGASICML